jgi:hypothetical protein
LISVSTLQHCSKDGLVSKDFSDERSMVPEV